MSSVPPLRVAFHTLGCRSNHADTVDLQAALAERGAVPCEFDAAADVYVVNTCTVTDDADKTALRLMRSARRRNPGARIVVTGCMAETSPEVIRAAGIADAIIGTGQRASVLDAIVNGGPATELPAIPVRRNLRRAPMDAPLGDAVPGPGGAVGEVRSRARFHLRVQEGCENSCTFCIIPRSRGALSSRPPERVLEDIARLGRRGFEEVVLTGTHLGGYGEDLGSSLAELLRAIAAARPRPRIRLSSLDPNDVSCELIDIMAGEHVFCRHLHICVQAFSDPVLKRMNRRYRMAQVYEILRYAAEKLPGCCFGSDLIAGFPGESRQEVEQAMHAFLELPFSYLHVFPYSERTGTPATRLDGTIEYSERKRRVGRWRALSEQRRAAFLRALVGSELEIIVERIDYDDRLGIETAYGVTREFAPAVVPLAAGSGAPGIGARARARAAAFDEERYTVLCE